MGDEDIILLREELCLYPGKVKYSVSVTNRHIVIEQLGRSKLEDTIYLNDVIGCHVLQEKKLNNSSYLCIFSYPLKKKLIGSGVVRQRVATTFVINKKKTYQENLLLAETWKMTIKRLVAGENIQTKEDIENGSLVTRNLLVLVNPFSGRKKALTMYKEKVSPMFTEAEIRHTVRLTEHPGHAKEIAKELKVEDWDGIVIVSGDGLIHEVINGLMDREDWQTAINMPLGVVPGGSGNALAASVVYASTGLHCVASNPVMCIFEICRGQVCPMDLVGIEIAEDNQFSNPSVQNNPNPRNLIYSFMGVILGLIADIDIESESLRCLGGDLRTSIYGIIRIISLRKYDIEISYLPEEKTSKLSIPSQSDAAEAFADNKGKGDFECSNNKTFGTASPRPPPLHESLPDNWITERDNFVMVMANFMSHIADVNLCYCDCKLNDGKINLNLCGQNTTRRELMRAWTQMEDGTGVGGNSDFPKPIGKTIECTAFRIVPKRNRSQIIAADGEVLPYGPFQCHILPGLARVMTSKKN